MTTNFSASGPRRRRSTPSRQGAVSRFVSTIPAAEANVQLPRGVKLVSGSGWYHDEAIQAESARKN